MDIRNELMSEGIAIAGFTDEKVKDSIGKINCGVIELDGTLPVHRNVEIIKKWIQL